MITEAQIFFTLKIHSKCKYKYCPFSINRQVTYGFRNLSLKALAPQKAYSDLCVWQYSIDTIYSIERDKVLSMLFNFWSQKSGSLNWIQEKKKPYFNQVQIKH